MGLWILCPASALGKLMILVINQFKNSVYWWLGTCQAPPFMQSMCCLYGRSSQQHGIRAVVSFSKREGEEVTNVGIKAQTDGQTAGTGLLKEKVGSAQGKRVQGTYQESRAHKDGRR